MSKQIVVINGHPDPDPARFCHAVAAAYAEAASASGHTVRTLHVARLNFALLRSRAEWETGTPAPDIADAQHMLAEAEHVVLVFPLWLGDMPALLKGFLEQVFRPGFAIIKGARTLSPGLLKGKSAHIIVTMGMPAFVYKLFFLAHSVRSLRRNILQFVGFGPIRQSIIGNVEGSPDRLAKWLDRIREHARKGQ